VARANLFSIPPGAAFLPTFVEALKDGRIAPGFPGRDPIALADATIYAPTQRAARALASELARSSGGFTLLPRIVPLGAAEDLETTAAFEEIPEELWPDQAMEEAAPDAMDEIERRLTLARLILGWGRAVRNALVSVDGAGRILDPDEAFLVSATQGQAWVLARDLAAMIDEFIIEDVPWSALDRLVPDEFDRYWGITLDFLKIAREAWPAILAERGCVKRAARRSALLQRAAERIGEGRGAGPTIAIGSTGTNRATARLLAAIARSPSGAVVLPGLDKRLDVRAWGLIADPKGEAGAAGHPQAALRRLLEIIGVSRDEVEEIGSAPPALARRAAFVSEALLPADATERWPAFDRTGLSEALRDVELIEAADEREEALALAIRMRKALETPGLTAALITPDRGAAARVRLELTRWKVDVDDSAGEPLAEAPAGVFARLLLRAAAESEFSVDSLALLAHPAALLGFARDRTRALAALAEIAAARSDVPLSGDLAARLGDARIAAKDPHAHPAVRDASDEDWADLERMAAALAEGLRELRALSEGAPLSAWIDAHRRALAAIGDAKTEGDDARALEDLLERMAVAARRAGGLFDARDYLDVFEGLARERAVRRANPGHPRLTILGLLEARLMSFDLVLLAGLDETIWPPAASTGPFLNRPMRAALGLTPPERRIGQTAQDFAQAMGTPQVVLSRARKRGGSPTTPSRLLQRMEALAGAPAWAERRRRGDVWLALAELIDRAPPAAPIGAPQPRPPVGLRPKRLSVTRIETLRRDPYAIYAEFILRLSPLPPLVRSNAARVAGEELHALLADFVRAHPDGAPPVDAATSLREAALARFAGLLADIEWRTFHWPRVERALDFFVSWETARRDKIARIYVEQRGELTLALADGSSFSLVAIADRLEKRRDGRWAIIDYKSGRAPSPREIACGFAPQLTLEAAMIERGAFPCAPAPAAAAEAFYLTPIQGGARNVLAETQKDPEQAFRNLAAAHYEGAAALLSQFRTESTPYLSRPFPQFASRFAAYDHLARVKEWSSSGTGDEDS
jgi:ATP-dependent helicase/nuclease subunit B